MLFFAICSLLSLICLLVPARSIAITGANVPSNGTNNTGARPFRQEFSKFRTSGPAFDLYILALEHFLQKNQTQLQSYFQISGIHGLPYTGWDGVQNQYQTGFCTHGSILFPSWHRPYLALYEQILSSYAQSIATSYPNSTRNQYIAAAQTLRIPYWDWAFNATMPDPVNDPMITVTGPLGVTTIKNPLYTYAFHPKPTAEQFPPSDPLFAYTETVRYPDSHGHSQPTLVNAQLQANAQAIHDLTYQLIADQSDYAPFSNTGYTNRQGGSYNSLENMHNAIHSLVGNGGHMAIVPYSAFDPVFWLHHANVDRLFAIWQAIYPDSYTTSETDVEGTATNAPGSFEDVNTSLTPFKGPSGTFYTSNTARYTRYFGYAYPEVIDWNVNSSQLSSNVRAHLNTLYNPTGSIATRKRRRSLTTNNTIITNSTYTAPNVEDHQYFINIEVNKACLGRSFFIHFFLGPAPTSPSIWSFAPNLVASHCVLYTPTPADKTTTNQTTPIIPSYGQLPLNHALLAPSPLTDVLTSLSPDVIIPFLNRALTWKVQTFDDRAVDVDTPALDSLSIFVAGREVKRRGGGGEAGDEFPIYGPVKTFGNVRSGVGVGV